MLYPIATHEESLHSRQAAFLRELDLPRHSDVVVAMNPMTLELIAGFLQHQPVFVVGSVDHHTHAIRNFRPANLDTIQHAVVLGMIENDPAYLFLTAARSLDVEISISLSCDGALAIMKITDLRRHQNQH